MKKTIPVLISLMFVVAGYTQQQRTVSGKVSDGKTPLENVDVSILEKDLTVATDADGKYRIAAQTGDKLQFSYTGMKTITIRVEDVTRILNPVMVPDITELAEVVVVKSKRQSQKELEEDYVTNTNIIKTAYGFLDSQKAPGRIRMVQKNQILAAAVCILDFMRNRFAGINVIGNCQEGGSVTIRGVNSLFSDSTAIFDVDGQIFVDAPIWLDLGNIERMAVLSNFATTTAYGNLGTGGVVVINTIAGNIQSGNLVDRARLRNNYLTGKVLTQKDVDKNSPIYLRELKQSTSFEASKELFELHESSYASSPYFYLDAHAHFDEKWNQANYADQIISDNYTLFENNPVLLKALAYHYEERGRIEMANEIYKEVFILRPNYVQSYMDMANSYRDIGSPKQAASIYARYGYLIEEGFLSADTIGFGPIMEREYNNLLTLNKNEVVRGQKANKLFIAEEDFKGTRLVFEWNDSEAEFNLQFVNPDNQYYTWKHSLADNSEIVYREKDLGYSVTEYLMDGSLPGTWTVNVNYLGNKSLTPTYLKATVYYNYGDRAQRKETKVYKLHLKNVNQQLFKIQSSGTTSTN
ncbi:carboxypeptidase-like regulatory domain-containing protein [uncultured Croceitalea sp.]|uniref:carboxypeptidase-like regulatory domain-containing protein n=1 Tax=uncultured Croceitalea sp. TaxID=1798908 RepID=UPI003305E9E1